MIGRTGPCDGIYRRSGHPYHTQPERVSQSPRIAGHRTKHEVCGGLECLGLASVTLGGDKYGQDGQSLAGEVKVLQVECVVPHLIEIVGVDASLTNLKLDHEHRGPANDNRINAATDSRDVKLEENASVDVGQRGFEDCDLTHPGVSLSWVHCKGALRSECSE